MASANTHATEGSLTTFAKWFVFPWHILLFFFCVAMVVLGVEWVVAKASYNNSVVVSDAACTVTSFGRNDASITMNLDCGGQKDSTASARFITKYLNAPRPFVCIRYVWAYADCRFPGESSEE